MKKIVSISLLACIVALGSCNYESAAFKAMRASKDSLQNVYNMKDKETVEYLSIIEEVETNLAKIKEIEGNMSFNEGEATPDHRTRLQNDVAVIAQIIEENKAKVADLEQKLKNSNGRFAALNATIKRLNAQIAENESSIASLKAELEQKDVQIKALDSTVVVLNQNLSELNVAKEKVEVIASEQDKDLHTAYYFAGTSKELKNSGIIMKKGINKSKFTQIDIREVTSIDLNAKKGIVLSAHPASSYRIDVVEKKATLVITNVAEFWSISKYLVVKVKR
jgi:chromosome segregation ATPase